MSAPPSPDTAQPAPSWWRKLHWQIALGLLAALIFAVVFRQIVPMPPASEPEARAVAEATWATWQAPFAFVGELFIKLLKMIIVPLILSSVISGMQSIGDMSRLGRLGWRTIGYYLLTTFLAVTLGMVVVNLIGPGEGLNLSLGEVSDAPAPTPLLEVFAGIVPTNALAAFAAGDMLPTIFVAILTGVGLLAIGERGRPLVALVEAANELILKITDWIMATAPVGVAALFVATLLDPKLGDLGVFFADLGSYVLSVIVGLGLHAAVLLPLVYWLVTHRSPLAYVRALTPALLTAFSTASSSATYPVTLECVTDGAGVSRESANFVLPLGATINMDGTALYEAVAAVFIANALGFELDFTQQLVIVLTATLAAIGAAGVPSAGLVTMIIVLESVGLPGTAYGLVVAVDRILDMCRTTVNVWGDAVGAAVVEAWVGEGGSGT